MNNDGNIIKRILMHELQGLSLENQIVLIILETLLVFLPGIVLCFKKKTTIKRLFHIYLLVLFAGVMLSLTIFRRPIGSRAGILNKNVNLGFDRNGVYSPWSAIFSFLNILLFVPWGMLVYPLIRDKRVFARIIKTSFISFISSVCIETIQIITATGMFEVSDIVTNTMGGFMGSILMTALLMIHDVFTRDVPIEEK